MVGYHRLIVLPPAAQGKDLCGFVAVHLKGDGKFRAELRLYAQQFQHMGIGGRFVGPFLGQAPFYGNAVAPVGLVGVRVTDLHMGLIERGLFGHAQKAADAIRLNEIIAFQFLTLFFRQVFESTVGAAPSLTEIVLLDALVDGHGNGKERSKQHRRKGNSQHRHNIAGAVGQQGPDAQPADAAAIGNFHTCRPLTVPRSVHPRCG